APVTHHACRGGAGAGLPRPEDLLQQLDVYDIMLLVHPEAFEKEVLVVRIGAIEARDPCLRRGDDFIRLAGAEFDAGAVADSVLRRLQHAEKFLDWLAGDLFRLEQRPALRGDPIDAAVLAVAA